MKDHVSKKLEQFEEEIYGKIAQEQKRADEEIEQFQNQELEKYRDLALKDSYGMIQTEVAYQETDIHKIAAEKSDKYRRLLFARREEYRKEVFSKAKEKLIDFSHVDPVSGSSSKEYQDFLLKIAARLGENASAQNETILRIRREDLPLEEEISKAFGKICKVEESKEIHLGGIFAQNKAERYQEDQSIESRLEEQFPWFCEHSNMLISR